MKKSAEEIERNLCQFIGTEEWHKFSPLSKLLLTDGAKYLADVCGAFWFMDIIASIQKNPNVAKQDMQVCKLVKNKTGNGAMFIAEDGNDNVLYKQEIPFTDCPLAEMVVWVMNGVILLPSEN